MATTVIVLNDGETYTDIDGCCLVQIPDEVSEGAETEEFIKDAIRLRTPSVLTVFVAVHDTRPGPG